MMPVEFLVRPLHFLIFFLSFTSAGWDSPMPLSQLFDNMKHDIKAPPMSCVCLSFFFPYLFSSPTSVMTTVGAAVGFCCFVDSTTVSLGFLGVSLYAEVRC